MKKILLFGLMLLMVLPFGHAKEVHDIDLDIEVNISNRNNKYYVTLIINDQDDGDFDDSRFELNETFTDSFDNVEIGFTCEETEFFDLTTALIDTNREVIASCKNSDNMTSECRDCFQGLGKVIAIKDQYKIDVDEANNDSATFKALYDTTLTEKTSFSDKYKTCSESLQTKVGDYNVCSSDLREVENKPTTYGFVGLLIGIIGTVMFFKNKEPKAPEFAQFPER